jgi:hypothetical protein
LRLEQHHTHREPLLLALDGEPFDDRPVAKMYAIEIANRGDTAIRWELRGS